MRTAAVLAGSNADRVVWTTGSSSGITTVISGVAPSGTSAAGLDLRRRVLLRPPTLAVSRTAPDDLAVVSRVGGAAAGPALSMSPGAADLDAARRVVVVVVAAAPS